jgi:hypothetical protein
MADLTRVQNQVVALLGAGTRSAAGVPVYSTALLDKARATEEIQASCYNAAIQVARAVCESASSPFKGEFLDTMDVAHGQALPAHFGEASPPKILPYSGAPNTLAGVRRPYDRIESMRINRNNAYGPTHNLAYQGGASPLAGYYDIVDGVFYFTGYSATMALADFDRTDVFDKLNDGLEPVIIVTALAMSSKEGDTSDGIFGSWMQQAGAALAEIRAGATAFSRIDEALAIRGDRTA